MSSVGTVIRRPETATNGGYRTRGVSEGAASPFDATDDVDRLLEQMRDGDREAAAAFIMRYGSRIRRRVRGKLSPGMRRIFDSQEILSTVGRRLDMYIRDGRMEAASAGQLWALVFRMASNALVDKARVFRRLQTVEGEDGPFAQELLRRLRYAERSDTAGVEIEIEKAMQGLDVIDRQILSMWLVGSRHAQIADFVELTPVAVRKRWQKIKAGLQERFQSSLL